MTALVLGWLTWWPDDAAARRTAAEVDLMELHTLHCDVALSMYSGSVGVVGCSGM